MQENPIYKAVLYLCLSTDDEQQGERINIGVQRAMLMGYCNVSVKSAAGRS